MKKYVYKKDALPHVVLSEHAALTALFDYAFETAFRKVDYIEKAGWKPQLTCYPGIGVIWQWDSCFMTLITNYANGTLDAFNNLDNLYRLQRESDGYISMAYTIESEKEAYDTGRINPPLYAWAEWQHYVITGDRSRFSAAAPKIAALYAYIENHHRRACGLYWFDDPGSSGMDNSPRGEYPSTHLDGSGVCFVDLACQQALTADRLSKMYAVLGDGEKAAFYAAENARICALINRYHWDEKTGFYYDFFSRENAEKRPKLINTKTVAVAWTLLCGAATGERFSRVLQHFLNEDEFYTRIPFASLSRDDLNYDPTGGYWLGSSWHPTNFVLLCAMYQNGYVKEARAAALQILHGIQAVYENADFGGIWEAYSPEEYKPATLENGGLCQPEFVGWGGLMPITALIEIVVGINCNAPQNAITFRLLSKGDSGVENLHLGGQTLSVCCRGYDAETESGTLCVRAEKSFSLTVETQSGKTATLQVAPGYTEIAVAALLS